MGHLRWTRDVPTVAGFYWLRVTGEFEPEVVRIDSVAGTLQAYLCGSACPVPIEAEGHEWCGPLTAPAP